MIVKMVSAASLPGSFFVCAHSFPYTVTKYHLEKGANLRDEKLAGLSDKLSNPSQLICC